MSNKGKNQLLSTILDETLKELAEHRSERTLENYTSGINKAKVFVGEKWSRLKLNDIDDDWMEDFITWLLSKHKDNMSTVLFYVRTFRAVVKHAQRFASGRSIKTTNSYLAKRTYSSTRAMNVDKINELKSPELRKKLSASQLEALDVLLFSYYACGMVFMDIYNLRWDMIVNNHICYKRSKTGIEIVIEIKHEMKKIMQRYRRANSPFVFAFLHENRNAKKGNNKELSEKAALRRINRAAKEIVESGVTSINDKLTTYVMRHTWASSMLENEVNIEIISQCLGHTSILTTQIYLKRISIVIVDKTINQALAKAFGGN